MAMDEFESESETGDRLVEIARLLLGGDPSEVTLQRVVEIACSSVPGCDDAVVVLEDGRRAATSDDAGGAEVLSFPLAHGEKKLGTLELHGSAFDDRSRRMGTIFAELASVALHHAQLYGASVTLGEQLQEALTSRAVIDQAKGVLMERLACDADTAFAALREASQRMNRKVRDLAQELVANAGRSSTSRARRSDSATSARKEA
jgi:GAF domain-containing protein